MGLSPLFVAFCLISTTFVTANRGGTAENPIASLGSSHRQAHLPIVQTRISDLGEQETRVVLDGVRALETTVPSEGEHYLFVREAVKHNRLVWIVYKNKQILDCNISTHEPDVHKFMNKFDNFEVPETEDESVAVENGDSSVLVSELVNFRGLLRTCRSFKKQVRALRIEKHHQDHNMIRQEKLEAAEKEPGERKTKSRSSRSKRSVFSMIYPGTNWCGRGDQAAGGYDDLGENVGTDRCCREHDHCPYMIDSFSTNYNYWNYRLHTLTHCMCEERFKACLKSTGSSVANMIGYIYFNYVGTECFTLKPEKTCAKRSWWGNCLKYDTTYTAEVLETSLGY